jgi:hypothetical protein
MSPPGREPTALELAIGGAPLLLSTLSFLLGSTTLGVLALVIGGISFGIVLGARKA